ncbi:MAG: MBL fold metallo-hydrolase [Dehalococcoidales bacterium]|jgi:glyoxylase-like metal-dependent hydrolase (beta-lactamase superfamily II)
MEIRVNKYGPDQLSTKVFFSDESGFAVASVIVMGKKDAALIDTQWSLSNGHRVAAEILETGKNLKTIYITHAHPDHYFGLGPIAEAFPQAKVVALPAVANTINKQMFGKIDHWRNIIGPTNVPTKAVNIEPLAHNYFELEGQRIEILPEIMGDLRYNTVVWIPSIKTLYGSDVLFNQAHPFTCEITADERKQWVRDIGRLEKMGAEVVIPGHQKPGMPFDSSSFGFTRDYLIATEEELAQTKTTGDFFYAMAMRYPDANLLFLSNEMNSAVFKGNRDWNWRDE